MTTGKPTRNAGYVAPEDKRLNTVVVDPRKYPSILELLRAPQYHGVPVFQQDQCFGDGREEQIDRAAILDDLHAEQLAWAWLRGYWTAIEDGSKSEQD
jgi:hypothetical protein